MSEGNGHNPDATLETQVIAKDSESVVELRAAELDPGAGESAQSDQDIWTPADTIEPPENLPLLSKLTRASDIRGICIDALTRNTVGLGWDVDVWPEHEGQVDKDAIRAARHKLDALARRDKRLDRPSFSTLMSAAIHDLEEFGNGYVEVSRNRRNGQIDGLYHLPGQLVRRRKERDGWVMGQNPELVEGDATRRDYYNFGEKVIYDGKGNPVNRLQTPTKGWKRTEVIALRHFTSESRDYGLPRDIQLVTEYAAYKYVIEWTQSFFGNSGTPPTVLFVQGQEQKDGTRVSFKVDASVVRRIRQAMVADGPKGRQVVVVPVPPGTNIQAQKLSSLSDRDITFGDFKKEHRSHVGSNFGLQPIFYGATDDTGRYTAEVERAFCLEETFDPAQSYVEDKLWTTLMGDLSYSELRVRFKRLAVESDSAQREMANNGATYGAITVGEWRQLNGLGPLPWDGAPNDTENPNNKLFTPTAEFTTLARQAASGQPDPHAPVQQGAQDQRGLTAGVGQRPGRDSTPPPVESGTVAKSGEGEPHVEEAVEDLAAELREYGPHSG